MTVKKTLPDNWRAEVELQVPFHDVDMMEVAWHGHYVKYFEIARCTLLDRLEYDYPQMRESGYAWPVIDLRIRYAKPLRFQQWVVVRAEVAEYENRLKINYQVRDRDSGARLTKGHTVQVAVDMSNGEMLFASPPVLLQKLGVA
ncbi:acyl-CoA thioesterase [Microbulbifer rhizosphaerae]|uniref:Acyl-CoA thioester hydrolase n=1 Tax=Microbulbifer rhizosphaerae TaxID=1562603 RepID=A0A7W4WFJ5_9GAMM|nr:thioesterase family protein [Microbulbifer rhizosphaerae]MBB3062857.1 acyl-CoA thioester hydrolase [Microbulbifer rhizosphaerae]